MSQNQVPAQQYVLSPSAEKHGTASAGPRKVKKGQDQEVKSVKHAREKKSSPLWKFFEEVEVPSKKKTGNMESRVKCKACGAELPNDADCVTSHWVEHFEQSDYFKFHQKIRKLMCQMVILEDLPFSFVENTWFRVLMRSLSPAYTRGMYSKEWVAAIYYVFIISTLESGTLSHKLKLFAAI
ncbi:hypothetical protein ACP4OV_019309 [Aristida adscensionis]